jgi:hypothetical protein
MELSPVSNITEWLLSQTSPAKPWMKMNPTVGSTAPIASAIAKVKRHDTGLTPVLVYVSWMGNTSSGHAEEFGFAWWFLGGGQSVDLGPKNISNVMPAVGKYELYLRTFVLSEGFYNINITADFHSGYFKALGYCDVNNDNVVDVKDYQVTKKAVGSVPGSANWNYWCDVDVSNSVTVADYQRVKGKIPTTYTEA